MACRTSRWAGTVFLAATALVVVGCGGAQRDSGGTITASGAVGVERLAVGDCVSAPTGTVASVTDVTGIPCSQAHDGEVFLTKTLPEGDFPGATQVTSTAESLCAAAVDAYLGISLDETALEVYYLYPPDAESWSRDRGIACILHHPGQDLTGSLRGNGSQHLFTAASLKVGECLDQDGLTVPCTGQHAYEVYRIGTLPDSAYSDAVTAEAARLCETAFQGYVGTTYAQSAFDYAPVHASATGWASGDRTYACLLTARDEKATTGSAKGSGR